MDTLHRKGARGRMTYLGHTTGAASILPKASRLSQILTVSNLDVSKVKMFLAAPAAYTDPC
jgi:hypothetical protein